MKLLSIMQPSISDAGNKSLSRIGDITPGEMTLSNRRIGYWVEARGRCKSCAGEHNLFAPVANQNPIAPVQLAVHIPSAVIRVLREFGNNTKKNSVALVRKRTIPRERPPPVGEVSANFCR